MADLLTGTEVKFDANMYDYRDDSIAKQLFENCTLTLNMTKPFTALGESASSLLNGLKVKFMGIDPQRSLGPNAELDRKTFILARDFLSHIGISNKLDEYTKEESWVGSKIWYFITNPSRIFSSDPETLNCDKPASKLGREDFVFCEQAKAFFAEQETAKIKAECGLKGSPLIPNNHLENMGTFIHASEDGNAPLSINPAKTRIRWEEEHKTAFCKENPLDNRYCSDDLPSPENSEEYYNDMLDLTAMPAKIRAEVEASFGDVESTADTAKTLIDNEEL